MTKKQISKEVELLRKCLEDVRDRLDTLRSEAEDYHGNKSERWQESDAGEAYQEMIDTLQSAYDNCDSAVTDLDNIMEA